MASVATGPRQRGRIMLRGVRYRLSEIPRRLGLDLPTGVESLGVFASTNAAATDVMARLAWAVAPGVAVIAREGVHERRPGWAGGDVLDSPANLSFGDPSDADLHLIADAGGLRWIRRAFDRRAVIGDPYWYSSVEVEAFVTLSGVGTSTAEWQTIRDRSAKLLERLQAQYRDASVAVFGTGPSMSSVDLNSIGTDLIVACNSVVSNRQWLAAARPTVLAFGDPVFHFGPSRYAAQFRSDLRRAAAETDAVFVIPERYAPLVERNLPEVATRMIAVRHARDGSLLGLQPDHLVVPQTANVLTLLMLPVALSLGSDVTIAGCDGRRPAERYFWQHNTEVQYGDELMKTAFDAHPSFFRDRDYVAYYETHCRQLEMMLSAAEESGARFRSLTPSEIPALRVRTL